MTQRRCMPLLPSSDITRCDHHTLKYGLRAIVAHTFSAIGASGYRSERWHRVQEPEEQKETIVSFSMKIARPRSPL
jgi:hypothetical protein